MEAACLKATDRTSRLTGTGQHHERHCAPTLLQAPTSTTTVVQGRLDAVLASHSSLHFRRELGGVCLRRTLTEKKCWQVVGQPKRRPRNPACGTWMQLPWRIELRRQCRSGQRRCLFAGCTDEEALNYDRLATVDDNTCRYDVCPDFSETVKSRSAPHGLPPPLGLLIPPTSCPTESRFR